MTSLKARFSTLPVKVLLEVIACFTRGAAKADVSNKKEYGQYGWRVTPNAKEIYIDALQRHLLIWIAGENTDPDSSSSHLVHVIANAMILRDLEMRGKESVKNDKNYSYDVYAGRESDKEAE